MRLATSSALLVASLAFTSPVLADLPKTFDWSDQNIWSLARTDPAAFDAASPAERVKLVDTLLMCPDQSAGFGPTPRPGDLLVRGDAALSVLARASDLDRFEALQLLDRSSDTNVRKIYDTLDAAGQAQLLALTRSAGTAGTKAGLQQLGVISDNDDTAFPTQFKPNGPIAFKGSADFYKQLVFGTDGKGNPGNMHYVSARPSLLGLNSRVRIAAAGLPKGTFDYDTSLGDMATGLDGIEASKIKNLDLWLKLHPGQRFVFLGDTIQRDPEVYRWVLQNHPDSVELVMIHRAGGSAVRDPANYKGEVFFDDFVQAKTIVDEYGIPQPGAKLPAPIDPSTLPLPNTDVSKINADGFPKSAWDFVEETGASFGKVVAVDPAEKLGKAIGHVFGIGKKADGTASAPSKTPGIASALDGASESAPGTD
jgi:hypothetical protein